MLWSVPSGRYVEHRTPRFCAAQEVAMPAFPAVLRYQFEEYQGHHFTALTRSDDEVDVLSAGCHAFLDEERHAAILERVGRLQVLSAPDEMPIRSTSSCVRSCLNRPRA